MRRPDFLVNTPNGSHALWLTDEQSIRIDDETYSLDVQMPDPETCHVILNGASYQFNLLGQSGNGLSLGKEMDLLVRGRIVSLRVLDARTQVLQSVQHSLPPANEMITLRAPMPGLVSRIETSVGEHVKAGGGILILEAMKMENEIRSPSPGTVREILVKTGQTVDKNDVLAILSTAQINR